MTFPLPERYLSGRGRPARGFSNSCSPLRSLRQPLCALCVEKILTQRTPRFVRKERQEFSGIVSLKNPFASLCVEILCGIFLASSASAENVYTNHAGYAVSGLPVAIDGCTATLSNGTEVVTVPLSVFPETERRRLAADYATAHPGTGTAALLVPDDVRKAVDAGEKAIRRSRLRAAKGLCSQEESDAFCAETSAALDAWLDGKEKSGAVLPCERRAILSTLR